MFCSGPPRFKAGRPDSYATFIIGCVIQACIPMPRCAPPGNRDDDCRRKQSHDDEKSRPRRIDSDAGCDLGVYICARDRIVHPASASSDRPLRPASRTSPRCFLSSDSDADGRAQCTPLSWRTEIERLTFDVLDVALATSFKGIRT